MDTLGLVFRHWPADWRERWNAVLTRADDVFGDDGAGAHWAPDTARVIRRRLELFFGHLDRLGPIDPSRPFGAYLMEPILRPFVEDLRARVSPVTVAGYLRDIRIGLIAMEPDLDNGVIKLVTRRLTRTARPTRETMLHRVKPRDLYRAGIARMTQVEDANYEKEDVRAVQYGDGLAMAILAAAPIRLRNLTGLRLGSSLIRIDGAYRIVLAAHETKGRRAHAADLPEALTSYIDHYIARHRRKLLGDWSCDHLFISCYRGPMSDNSMRGRFKEATRDMLGVALSPHQARHIAVTAIAEERPDQIGLATPLLGHARQRTTLVHYNLADQLSAGRDFNAALADLRAEAHDAMRRGTLFEEEPPT